MGKEKSIANEHGYMAPVKVGPKGQIVIPKEVREMFGIEPGDSLMILASSDRGIALHKTEFFYRMATEILSDKAAPVTDKVFAEAVETVKEENDEEN